jgi:hypothetical protein
MGPVASSDDDRSPWLRDDWDSDHQVGEHQPAAAGEPERAPVTSGPPRTQVVLAALVGTVLLAVGVIGLVRADGDGAADVTATTIAPGLPVAEVTIPPATVPEESSPASTVTSETSGPTVGGLTPGEDAVWTESTIEVPSALVEVASTEVVVLTGAGLLHRIDLPTGRVRTVDVAGIDDGGTNLVVDDRSIVLYASNALYRIPDDGPVVATKLPEGVVSVQSRPGTGQFVVTSPTISATDPQQEWILQPDGTLDRVRAGQFVDGMFYARTFSPAGDVLVNRPGGVYAIDAEGSVRRIADGDLIATGTGHYAVEECDQVLQCTIRVVAWSTGDSTVHSGSTLVSDGFLDPSTRISPDGTAVVFRGITTALDARRIADLRTGDVFDVGRVNKVVHPDTWAADGSGLFRDDSGRVEFVVRATREVVRVGSFDGVTALFTRPLAGAPG